MTGSSMTLRTALPGMAAGAGGLVAGIFGVVAGKPVLGLAAGGLAAGAGVATLLLARRLEDQMALHALADRELEPRRLLADADGGTGGDTPTGVDPGPVAGSALTPPEARGGAAAEPSLVDPNTGLFTETFFRVAIESRIAAARRHLRPIAVVLVEVVEGLAAGAPNAAPVDLVSTTIRTTLREADTACRLHNGYYSLLLEDTPENGAIWTVERIRRKLGEIQPGLTVWAGVACYPAHAFTSDELLDASERALVAAREWRQDRIEVAIAVD